MVFVGLNSWIIQDGNYGDFHVGQTLKFALEFCPRSLQVVQSHEPMFERIKVSEYRIRGQVIYVDPTAWVIDFGLKAYQYRKPPQIAVNGSWVEGEIDLGVDPLFYFKELHARPEMPTLQYEWRIRKIHLETTPRLSIKNANGGTTLVRDKERESFVEVAETKAEDDDEGLAEYILECEKLG